MDVINEFLETVDKTIDREATKITEFADGLFREAICAIFSDLTPLAKKAKLSVRTQQVATSPCTNEADGFSTCPLSKKNRSLSTKNSEFVRKAKSPRPLREMNICHSMPVESLAAPEVIDRPDPVLQKRPSSRLSSPKTPKISLKPNGSQESLTCSAPEKGTESAPSPDRSIAPQPAPLENEVDGFTKNVGSVTTSHSYSRNAIAENEITGDDIKSVSPKISESRQSRRSSMVRPGSTAAPQLSKSSAVDVANRTFDAQGPIDSDVSRPAGVLFPVVPVVKTQSQLMRTESKTCQLFSSAGRLGGVSRLQTGHVAASHLATHRTISSVSTTGSHKSASLSTSLSVSVGGHNSTSERVRSAQLLKNNSVQLKRELVANREAQRRERIKAFIEEKKQKFEERRRANEEHRLAVKQRAKNFATAERALLEKRDKLQQVKDFTSKTPHLGSAITSSKHLAKLNGMQSVQSKPADPPACADPQPLVVAEKVTTISGPVPSHTQPSTEPAANHQPPHHGLPTSRPGHASPSFNISLLPSDSDSEDDFKMKVPPWARKGAPEVLHMAKRINNGEVKVPDEFIPPCRLKFDVPTVFRDFNHHDRPRRSSAVWATRSGHHQKHLKRLL